MADGSITTAAGHGPLTDTTGRPARGGSRLWSRSISRSTTIAGTRSAIIIAIAATTITTTTDGVTAMATGVDAIRETPGARAAMTASTAPTTYLRQAS